MRIIAGRFKGLRLPSPRKQGVRPTTDRVREALFSTLGHEVEDSRVLDLFAGTGAFGFEALSRGAASVVFVDDDRQVTHTLITTCDALRVVDQVRILTMSADQAVQTARRLREEVHNRLSRPAIRNRMGPKGRL